MYRARRNASIILEGDLCTNCIGKPLKVCPSVLVKIKKEVERGRGGGEGEGRGRGEGVMAEM